MNVQAVGKVHGVEVHAGESEHILVDDLPVAQEEIPARPRVLLLHHAFDANILHHIADAVEESRVVALLLRFGKESIGALLRSPQGMADLMRHKHGLKGIRHIPNGHDEVTGLGIERGGRRVGIERERKILGGKRTGKDGERSVHIGIVTQVSAFGK